MDEFVHQFFRKIKMNKVNIGLVGIFIIIIMILSSIFYLNSRIEKLFEQLQIVNVILEDIDRDIHELEKDHSE